MSQPLNLPNEILEKIILHLPIKTLINKQLNTIAKEKGWKNHYIKDFPANKNTAALIKESLQNREPDWFEIYKEEHNNRKQEDRKKRLLNLHWKMRKSWYERNSYHKIKTTTDALYQLTILTKDNHTRRQAQVTNTSK